MTLAPIEVTRTGRKFRGPHSGYGQAYRVNELTGCHIWSRFKDKDGYGIFRIDGRSVRAHIFYYEQKYGPVPDGLELDHKCERRDCVNPDHMEAVTHAENVRRGGRVSYMTMEKAREVRARKAQGQTHKQIAEEMQIGFSLVGQIVTNRCWRELEAQS